MMRWNGFGGSLVFAAVAAAALLAALLLVAPLLGTAAALRLFAVGSVVAYLAGLGPSWRRGCVAALAAATLGGALLLLPAGVRATALCAAALLAVCRSGLLYRQPPLRACVAECVLLAVGLGLADFLASGSAMTWALAAWGYFLVQSVFFLIGGVRVRRDPGPSDPFDRARAELVALLG